jgi:low affinity Fe/Cu permease
MDLSKPKKIFSKLAKSTSMAAGKPATFCIAFGTIIVWAISGPIFGFSDTWQLIINTGTTIITFLMVFLIQNSQNRDGEALQIKIDELLRVTKGAHVVLLDLEELEDHELKKIRRTYVELAADARQRIDEGGSDTDVPEVTGADCVPTQNSR